MAMGVWEFFKTDEEVIGEGVVANHERSKGHGQNFHICPHPTFITLAMPMPPSTLHIFAGKFYLRSALKVMKYFHAWMYQTTF